MKRYQAFGLVIKSEIELLAVEVTDPYDVLIKTDKTQYMTEEPILNAGWIKVSKSQAFITVPEVGSFLIRNGREIVLHPDKDSDQELARSYIMGTCMGILLQQRGIMSIHASCVAKGGEAFLIMGESGAGKSSIAAEFISQGWKLMSDDLTPIVYRKNKFYAIPSYPGQKLWNDTITDSTCADDIISMIESAGGREKYQLRIRNCFQMKEMPVTAGVLLSLGKKTLRLDQLVGFGKSDTLIRNVYRVFAVVDKEGKSKILHDCIEMSNQMDIYLAVRPEHVRSEKDIVDWLINKLER